VLGIYLFWFFVMHMFLVFFDVMLWMGGEFRPAGQVVLGLLDCAIMYVGWLVGSNGGRFVSEERRKAIRAKERFDAETSSAP